MNNVTLIDDLPTIEELEIPKSHGMTMIPQNEANRFKKFIRNNGFATPEQSGMMSTNKYQKQPPPVMRNTYREQPQDDPNNLRDQMYEEIDFDPQQHRYHPPNDKYMPQNDKHMSQNDKYNPYRTQENFDTSTTYMPKKEHTCVDIAEHTASCLVCSKLYGNNNVLLIILVVFLAFVNILLLKYVLETCKQS